MFLTCILHSCLMQMIKMHGDNHPCNFFSLLTSHTVWASMTQWARRRGWRRAACAPGICSSAPWARSGRWSWCCWASRCSCRRRWAALCCAAGWSCGPGTGGETSSWTGGALCPRGHRLRCWKCRMTPWRQKRRRRIKRSWPGFQRPGTCQQDGWRRPATPAWSPQSSGWSSQCASPLGCGQWWTTEKWGNDKTL